MGKYGADYAKECRGRKEPLDDEVGFELCSDCPPTDYPHDYTRCLQCPRRARQVNAEPK